MCKIFQWLTAFVFLWKFWNFSDIHTSKVHVILLYFDVFLVFRCVKIFLNLHGLFAFIKLSLLHIQLSVYWVYFSIYNVCIHWKWDALSNLPSTCDIPRPFRHPELHKITIIYWISLYLAEQFKFCWAYKIKFFHSTFSFCHPIDSAAGER